MKTLTAITLASFPAALLMACSGGGAGAQASGEPNGFPLDGDRFAETCAGTYECTWDAGEAFTIKLFMGTQACLFDSAQEPGGYPAVLEPTNGHDTGAFLWDGEDGNWMPTWSGFDVCGDSGACFRCSKTATPSAQEDGRCKGAADACSSVGPGSCATQSGCVMTSKVMADGSLGYQCTGTAMSCNTIYGETACRSQNGCVWE